MRSPRRGFRHIPQLGDVRERERADEPNKASGAQPPHIRQNLSPPLAENCERTRADFA